MIRKISFLFKSFKIKVTLAFILAMLFSAALSNFLIYRYTLNSQFNQLREKLKISAQAAVLIIDPNLLMQVPLNKDGINTQEYKAIAEKLKKVKEAIPPIRYIYTMTKTDKDGIWQFIVDPEPLIRKEGRDLTSYPGDKYNAARFPEMLKAFEGPSADKELTIDEWGVTLSGYAPIYDNRGNAVAVLGVDIMADDVYKIQKEVDRRAIFTLVIGVVLSIILGLLISKSITDPVRTLVEGMRHISEGNLRYQIKIKGDDEISELAKSFNKMAENLSQARRKLHTYFYNMMSSFVRIIEAKDYYTRGHSERVAKYAIKIAQRMGLSKERIELLRETALLHDIGKLGVQESLLHKKERLTEAEWEVIRKHPIIGEDILRPVSLNKEMLTIIRSHHEHYDGTGYPDHLAGEHIDKFSQILSVVDAYDAMTSTRPYRQALTKEQAIGELNKSRGKQFNPEIVDIFLQVLQEEKY